MADRSLNPILDSSNHYVTATYDATPDSVSQIPCLPLGKTAAGEIYLKTSGPSGASTATITGTVTATPKQYTTISNAAPGGATTAQTVFTLAAGEKGFIQNLAIAPLNVKYGAGASAASLSFVEKAGSTAIDGLGGYVTIDDWIGAVSVFPQSGTSAYIAWKLS